MKGFLKAAIVAAVLATSSSSALANLSFTGNLADDNDVELFDFTLASTSDVTLRTWSYAGGTNAAGNLIAAGGFDPIVSLFFGTGSPAILFDANDDGFGSLREDRNLRHDRYAGYDVTQLVGRIGGIESADGTEMQAR